MPDPTTPAKGLTQPTVGGDNNTWGGLLNTNLSLIDSAIGGTLALSISGNTTLNPTQAQNGGYHFTGSLSGTATITWPSFFGLAVIRNHTTGGFSIVCGISGATVTIPNGETIVLWSDGTDFIAFSKSASTVRPVTANTTITTGDCGNVVQAGTGSSGLFTVSLPAASGFPTGCVITVANGDTGRGKILSGFPADLQKGSATILWPNQTVVVANVNGTWTTIHNPGVWTSENQFFQVDHGNGNDSGDGLGTGSGAFATIQFAVNFALENVYTPKANINFQVAAGTFTENAIITSTVGAAAGIYIEGTPGTPSNTIWQTSGTGLLAFDNAFVLIDGFKFQAAGGAGGLTGINPGKKGFVEVDDVEFGSFPTGNHVIVSPDGYYNYGGGSYKVSGSMSHHVFMFGGTANLGGAAVSMPNALTFTSFVNAIGAGSNFTSSATFSGTGSGSGSTGLQFTATNGAGLSLNGTTLPGNSAGTLSANATQDGNTATPVGVLMPVFGGSGGVALTPGTTQYVGIGAISSTESFVSLISPTTHTITSLYVFVDGVPGAGKNFVFTLRLNGGDTPLTCTISGTSTLTANDTAHTQSWPAGATVDLKVVSDAGSNPATVSWSCAVE